MRILITNDDGIHAEGLEVLQNIAATLSDDVWTVAPETDQSGLAHSLTLSEPLRLREVAERQFALRGTPTDCVIMGVRRILDRPPDLILSGVNAGQNIADDVTYSGTIAGAMEGTLLGIRSIALSQAYDFAKGRIIPWSVVAHWAPIVLPKLIEVDLPQGTFLNVNFPAGTPEDVTRMSATSQGRLIHSLTTDERHDGRGFPYFWLKFTRENNIAKNGTDLKALRSSEISVTPLKLDLTNHEVLSTLSDRLSGEL